MLAISRRYEDRDAERPDRRAVVAVVVFHAVLILCFAFGHAPMPMPATLAGIVWVEMQHASHDAAERRSLSVLEPRSATHASQRQKTSPARRATSGIDARAAAIGGAEAAGEAETSARAAAAIGVALTTGAAAVSQPSAEGRGTWAGPRFRPPQVTHRVRPDYPADAFQAHQQGTTDVIVTVASGGNPTAAHVYQSSGTASLDDAAVQAVLAYTFRAGERNGKPTDSQAIVTIDWQIGADTMRHIAVAGPKSTAPSRVEVMRQLDCVKSATFNSSAELCKHTHPDQ